MLESTRLREQVNGLEAELRSDRLSILFEGDDNYETRLGERGVKRDKVNVLNDGIIKALDKEDSEAQAAMATHVNKDGWTAELRAFHELGQRTSIVEYMQAGLQQRQLSPGTPEHEYNSHVFGGSWNVGEYPLEMLLDRGEFFDLESWQARQVFEKDMEQRTEITGVVGTAGTPSFVDRLLADSEGAFCRAVYPAVGPGRHSYPIVTGSGNLGTVIARGSAETVAGGITVTTADPTRIQHSFEVARADELQMPGIMSYLANDLRMGLASGLDNKVIDDLVTGLGTAIDTTGSTTVTFGTLMSSIATAVNGRGARYFQEVRVLAGNTSGSGQTTFYAKSAEFFGSASTTPAWEFLTGPNFRASAHMKAAAGGEDEGILILLGPATPRLIVPTWRRGEILRDTGRLQLQGSVTLTGAMYADVVVASTDMHDLISIDTQ